MGSIIYGLGKHLDYTNMLAGMVAGVTTSIILHPLELIKVRMQVDETSNKIKKSDDISSTSLARKRVVRPHYTGVFHAFRHIYYEGGFRGLYQGVTPNMWGSGVSWGIYFFLYNGFKSIQTDYLIEFNTTSSVNKKLPPHIHMLSAFVAGACTSVLTNPIWMMKTRLCLQYKSDSFTKVSSASSKNVLHHYNGMIDGLYKVIRYEGFFALFKGLSFGILGTLHGVIQFSVYEQLKQMQHHDHKLGQQLPAYYYALYSGISKITAVISTYPLQLIRSRLQDQHSKYNGGVHVIKSILQNEGYLAFYKGIIATLLRVTPASCITFVVYETTKHFLSTVSMHSQTI